LKRAFLRWKDDQMTDHAAALTYYTLLSLFPAILFAVSVLGFFGSSALVNDAVKFFGDAGAPPQLLSAVEDLLKAATSKEAEGAALTALILSLATSLYGASGAFGAVGRALNRVWRVDEGRSFVRHKLNDIMWTAVLLVLVLITFVLIFLGGDLANEILGIIGIGDAGAAVWKIARWPAALVVAMLIYAIVYFAAPNVKAKRFEWVTPGAALGVVLWLVASAGFFLYVSTIGTSNAAYGAFGGVIVLLTWLWITNLMLLFGAELNAVIRLRRAPDLPETYDGPPLPEKVPAEA
jgi:membrane protein